MGGTGCRGRANRRLLVGTDSDATGFFVRIALAADLELAFRWALDVLDEEELDFSWAEWWCVDPLEEKT
ncbi:MAG: hypothetical protein KVP17_001105 [Porospora cf. gigantea B]|uniref:uncharacterized protein n=1 Tax=Porospora cf. gigantea B TaxID=2853592 RepID=UPI003571803F|nr:MAG: hypothetical protein KVP17_001105 [Porospora cf. gigantea B]